jgi:ketosteroid isomerase-like protein
MTTVLKRLPLGALALLLLTMAGRPSQAETTADTLLDRIRIEDMMVKYYADLGGDDAKAYAEFYTEDGVFEVNGDTYVGKAAITKLYASLGGGVAVDAPVLHMVLTNPVIDVTGDTATASFIWTGVVNNGDPVKPPFVREQGREFDKLVKRDGKWLIKKRVVIADSGLPKSMLDTWKRKLDYDIGAE